MIGKNIDIIAVAFLLAALAVFSSAKHVVVMTMRGPVHYYRLDNGRQVRIPPIPKMPEMPDVPRIPNVPLQRD